MEVRSNQLYLSGLDRALFLMFSSKANISVDVIVREKTNYTNSLRTLMEIHRSLEELTKSLCVVWFCVCRSGGE